MLLRFVHLPKLGISLSFITIILVTFRNNLKAQQIPIFVSVNNLSKTIPSSGLSLNNVKHDSAMGKSFASPFYRKLFR